MTAKPLFKRVLLKASGEALMGSQGFGIDVTVADRIAADIAEVRAMGVEVGVVVGGGNSAGQAAMYLSRTAKHVHVVVRGDSLASSMSRYLTQRLESAPAITIHYNTEITALHGDTRLDAVTFTDGNGEERQSCGALFIMIGAAPNSDWLSGMVELDERGFVKTGDDVGAHSQYETSQPGIFAIGDVRSGSVKRVASAVGEGSVVISSAWARVAEFEEREASAREAADAA